MARSVAKARSLKPMRRSLAVKNQTSTATSSIRLVAGWTGKQPVFSLVERGDRVRSRTVKSVSAKTLRPIMTAQIDRATHLMTDDAGRYRNMARTSCMKW